MEEFGTVDEVKPKAEAGMEVDDKKKHEVAQNDAGSAAGLDLLGNEVFNNTIRYVTLDLCAFVILLWLKGAEKGEKSLIVAVV